MVEDRIIKQQNAIISKSIQGMIQNATAGFEQGRPAPAVGAQHQALRKQIATSEAIIAAATAQKAERLKAHAERLAAKAERERLGLPEPKKPSRKQRKRMAEAAAANASAPPDDAPSTAK